MGFEAKVRDEVKTVPPIEPFGVYNSGRPGLRLVQRDLLDYHTRVHAESEQRRAERHLFALALHERAQQEQQQQSPKRATTAPAQRQIAPPPATQATDAASGPTEADASKPTESESSPSKRKVSASLFQRLAKLPKPPPEPAPTHQSKPVPRIATEDFAARFSDAQVKAASARRAKLVEKYTPRKPPPKKKADVEPVDWESSVTRLYQQEMMTRKRHMEQLQQKFAPAPPASTTPRVDDADIAQRMYRQGVARIRKAMAKVADQCDAQMQSARLHHGKTTTESQWKRKFETGFATPRGASP